MSKKIFIRGTLLLTFSGLISRIIGFFYRIFLSRIIGAQGLGIYQLVFPLQTFILAICASGIQTAISRLAASEEALGDHKKACDYFMVGTFFSLILSISFSSLLYLHADFWACEILKEPRTNSLIQMLSLSFPFSTLHSCINSYYFARKKTLLPAGIQILEQAARAGSSYILYLILISEKMIITPLIAVFGTLISEIMASVVSLFFISMHFKDIHYSPFRLSQPVQLLKNTFQISVPLTLNKILLTLLSSIEVILIPARLQVSGLSSREALSIYGIFTGMALPMILFPSALTNSAAVMLLPSVSQLQTLGHSQKIRQVISQIFKYCISLGLFCMAGFLLFGQFIGNFLFHSPTAGLYIKTLAFICPFLYLNATLTSVLNGLGRSGLCLIHSVISILIRMVFVIFMIPVLGIKGYFYGILLGELILTILHVFALFEKHFPYRHSDSDGL
ncbi:MAG: polysaccharide biosynthesis protein [Blautia sp.]|nr:polysaccharide biosynthesis protein [Blautia sp.]